MTLKPQDVLFLLKLIALDGKSWSFSRLALSLGMSPAEVHAAASRVIVARLARKDGGEILLNVRNIEAFLLYGLQYVFVPERGALTRGMPTAYAASPLADDFAPGNEPPPVWPDPEGDTRGESFSPLYRSVPTAAKNDPKLYELLVLADAIRGGRAREGERAKTLLKQRLAAAAKRQGEPMITNRDRLVVGDVLEISRSALRKLVQRYHIRRLVLFGSAARGELRPDSDIDLLVEFEDEQAPSLGGMIEIRDAFSQLFGGRKVDVATPTILKNPYRRRAIEQDMEELYAA